MIWFGLVSGVLVCYLCCCWTSGSLGVSLWCGGLLVDFVWMIMNNVTVWGFVVFSSCLIVCGYFWFACGVWWGGDFVG